MNKKGFTLIEIIAVIVILGILIIVATVSISSYLRNGREKSFRVLVENFKDATTSAYADCLLDGNANDFCRTHDVPTLGDSGQKVYLSELVANGYIEELKNPWNKKEKCDQQSAVTVTRIADSKGSISFDYKVCLICGNRKSDDCGE